MFWGCNALRSIDVSSFDTSKVTDMGYMFAGCWNVSSLEITNFNTSKVKKMDRMFGDCTNVTSLDVRYFDTSEVENMDGMFDDCPNLTTIRTPKKTATVVPALPEGIWEDGKGNTYTTFPVNATKSMILIKAESAVIL